MAARGFLGSGDLYIARYVNGAPLPYEGPYECARFEIKPNVNLVEMTSKGRASYGQVIESVTIPQPADLTVDLPEVNKESLAIALLGTSAAVSQTAGTLTNENVTNSAFDRWFPLTKAYFSTITAQDSTNQSLTEGEDFITDKQLGWIKFLATSTKVTVGEVVRVSGTFQAASGNDIKVMTNPQLRARFKLVGKNFADDLPYEVTVYEAVIAADSAFDFLQDNFAAISLPGRMKTPAGFTEPALVRQMTSVG
jgi:hypothetical protein